MKIVYLAGAAMALAQPAAAWAQDHSMHEQPHAQASAADEQPQPAVQPPPDHSAMDHTQMDHEEMDHGQMDHAQMDHQQAEPARDDHAGMEHGASGHPAEAHPGMDHTGGQSMDHAAGGMTGHAGMTDRPAVGSGTARVPQAEGMMPMVHFDIGGGWQGMAHGYAWLVHTDQSGPRGDEKTYVQSMAMLMADREFSGGRLQLRSMFSAEPLMDARGYPSLFATGETANGLPLVDRQHPHDLFMELAARIDLDVAPGTSAFLYGGPVGEPALGPPAFMHRASARLNPEAPITHHWFDSTHITYGVVTAGLASRSWQLEASAFRGEEPDEDRWDIETPRLDSWSLRATFSPSPNWAMQLSHGRLDEPEATHPGEDEARTTASVQYNSGEGVAALAAFAAKNRMPGNTLTAWLGEVNWAMTERHAVFGRVENVANDELFPDHEDPLHDVKFRVTKLQAGYAYTLPLGDAFALSLGGSAALFLAPNALDPVYGDTPTGVTAFAKLTLGR